MIKPTPCLRGAILSLVLAPSALLAQGFQESFDGVTAPALPPGWSATNAETAWDTTTVNPSSPPNAVFVGDANHVTDKHLDSPPVTLPAGGSQLIFLQTFDTESNFDGGVLEISIAGGPFVDIVTAGGNFLTGNYTGTIDPATGNPLGNRSAWTGSSGGYLLTTVNLPPSAGGQSIQLRWRMGTDTSNAGSFAGWTLDSISIPNAGFGQNFETATPPALPPGWTSANAADWATSATSTDTPPNEASAVGLFYATDRQLVSPSIAIPASGTATLTFRHRWDLEFDVDNGPLDFGKLEISIAGGAFQEFQAAGGIFTVGPPNFGTEWSGTTDGVFMTTVGTLPPSANGQSVQLRWRVVTDNTDGDATLDFGWQVDTITLDTCPPTAVASAAKTSICSNAATTLTGSGGDTCAWLPVTWLSDPFSCTPNVTPAGAIGTVTYTLTVTKVNCPPGSNTDTATVSVTSEPTPVAVASATRASICPGGLTTLRGSGGDTCVWSPAAGLSNPNSCSPSARPTSTVTYSLTVTNACGVSTNNASVTITVVSRPAGPQVSAPAAASAGQTGLVASVVDPNPGSTFTWIFSPVGGASITQQGLSSIVFTANMEGPLTLSVTENDGTCLSDPTVVVIPVGPACVDPQSPTDPKIQVSGNPDAPVTGIDYLDLSWTAPPTPPLFYLWSINGNPEQTTTETSVLDQPPTGSNDPITLQVRSACSEDVASEPAEVTVSPSPPVASFQIDSTNISVGTPVVFTDTSVPAATSWLWLFGDGSDPETTQSVTHAFAEGTYTVFLIASNGAGSSAASQPLEVPQTVFPSRAVALQAEPFDATRRQRQRLTAVSFAGGGPRWLHVQSHDETHEAVAFLRFLDSSGALVRERRLSIAPGQDAVFDLNAYGLRGVYDLELVSLRSVTASLVAPGNRQTREVRRPQR